MAESFYFATADLSFRELPLCCLENDWTCFGFCATIPWKETMYIPKAWNCTRSSLEARDVKGLQNVCKECLNTVTGNAKKYSPAVRLFPSESDLDQRLLNSMLSLREDSVADCSYGKEEQRQGRKTGRNQNLRHGQRRLWNVLEKGGEVESLPNKLTIPRPLLIVFHFCSPMLPGHAMQIQ